MNPLAIHLLRALVALQRLAEGDATLGQRRMQHTLEPPTGDAEPVALEVWQAHAVDVGVVDVGAVLTVAEPAAEDGPAQLEDLITQRGRWAAAATIDTTVGLRLEELQHPLGVGLEGGGRMWNSYLPLMMEGRPSDRKVRQ